MQEQQIAAFADDRRAWRNLVVACSAADAMDDDDVTLNLEIIYYIVFINKTLTLDFKLHGLLL